MTTAIKVENLSKKYLIGHEKQESYNTLRDSLSHSARSLARRLRHPLQANTETTELEEFWALKDINFEIKQGDRVGIIGRNGAGKSTLLKILSRITAPTTGKVTINGRVASLLEVGTGFHPELSGRENIFLNGAILGMRKAEIKSKFDEIVAFAEVEKFLDTPVKRYSSGMYVRLAFAVAAHLEPEILIVDEVLAVGDMQFQKKCLGKMEDVGKEGRTILFVSHNMNAIEQLCSLAICIDKGQVKFKGNDVRKIITGYLNTAAVQNYRSLWINTENKLRNPWFYPKRMEIIDVEGNSVTTPIRNDKDIFIYIEGEIDDLDPQLTIGFSIYNESGTLLYRSYHTDGVENSWPILNKGNNMLICKFPKNLLNEGNYSLELIGSLYQRQWIIAPGSGLAAVGFSIQGGLSNSPYWYSKRAGILAPILVWQKRS